MYFLNFRPLASHEVLPVRTHRVVTEMKDMGEAGKIEEQNEIVRRKFSYQFWRIAMNLKLEISAGYFVILYQNFL